MGYRHYFIKIEKEKIKELENLTERKLQTLWYKLPKLTDEDKDKYNKYGRYDTYGISHYTSNSGKLCFSKFNDFAYSYIDSFNKGKEIHELGKLYWDDTAERVSSKGKELNYKDVKIKERVTQDHCFVVGGREMIEEYMKICKEKYTSYIESLSVPEDEDKLKRMTSWISILEKDLAGYMSSRESKVETYLFNGKEDPLFSTKLVSRKKVIRKIKEELKKSKLKRAKYIKYCNDNKDKLIYDKLIEDLTTRKFRASYIGDDWEYKTAYIKLKALLDFNAIDFDKYYILLYAW